MISTRTLNMDRFKNSCGFTVTFSAWGNRRKADMSKVETNADKSLLKLSKELIVSKEYEAIKSFMGELRGWVYSKTVPSFFKEGFQLASLEAIEPIEARMMKASQEELPALVQAFLAVYPSKVEDAKASLRDQFNQRDYPSIEELRAQFDISWNWLSFTLPDQLPEALRQKETDKLERQLTDAAEEITKALREAFAELIKHATEKLKTEPGEKKKTFRDSLIGNIQEFIETFSSRNLMNDVDLARLVAQAKGILGAGVTPQKLRDYQSIREDTLTKFDEITKELDKMIVTEPRRKITLDDDEEQKPPTPEPADVYGELALA